MAKYFSLTPFRRVDDSRLIADSFFSSRPGLYYVTQRLDGRGVGGRRGEELFFSRKRSFRKEEFLSSAERVSFFYCLPSRSAALRIVPKKGCRAFLHQEISFSPCFLASLFPLASDPRERFSFFFPFLRRRRPFWPRFCMKSRV